jgi:hypothetical protein
MATPFGDDPANNENNSRITPNGDNKVQIGSRAVGGSGAPGSNRRAQRPELALDAFLEAVTEKRRRSQSREEQGSEYEEQGSEYSFRKVYSDPCFCFSVFGNDVCAAWQDARSARRESWRGDLGAPAFPCRKMKRGILPISPGIRESGRSELAHLD